MRPPALVPAHVPLAEAARIAERHGFVLETVLHDGRVRIAMVRRRRADGVTAPVATADADPAPPSVTKGDPAPPTTSDAAADPPTAEDDGPRGDR